jgi:hypothetical protein
MALAIEDAGDDHVALLLSSATLWWVMISAQIFFPHPRALHLVNSAQTPKGLFLSEDAPAAMKQLCDAAPECIKAASMFFIADANRIASQSLASLSQLMSLYPPPCSGLSSTRVLAPVVFPNNRARQYRRCASHGACSCLLKLLPISCFVRFFKLIR